MHSLCISAYFRLGSSHWVLAKAFTLPAFFYHYVTLSDRGYLQLVSLSEHIYFSIFSLVKLLRMHNFHFSVVKFGQIIKTKCCCSFPNLSIYLPFSWSASNLSAKMSRNSNFSLFEKELLKKFVLSPCEPSEQGGSKFN